jgi:hypothetical protein
MGTIRDMDGLFGVGIAGTVCHVQGSLLLRRYG